MTRILILVEDDDLKAKAVTRYASRIGYEVVRTSHLEEGLDLLDRFAQATIGPLRTRNTVVVTDWCFPPRKGYSPMDGVGKSIVAFCQVRNIPVRVFSGRDVPATGYEDIWFDSLSANGLMAWLEEEMKNGTVR